MPTRSKQKKKKNIWTKKDYLNAKKWKWRQKKGQKDIQNNKILNQEYENIKDSPLGFHDVMIKSYDIIHTSTQHQLDNPCNIKP